MIIGIDHGNAQIKTRNTCFVSGVEEFPTKPPMAADVIQYQSRYWTLVGKRLPVMRDKTKDDRFYLLTLFAISKELEARKEITSTLDIDLAVGLPPEHYGMLKDSFAQYFRRQETVRFTYNDKPFSLMLDHVFVYPQAFGAVVQRAEEMTATSRTFVIDIGGYTSDVLLLRKGKPRGIRQRHIQRPCILEKGSGRFLRTPQDGGGRGDNSGIRRRQHHDLHRYQR